MNSMCKDECNSENINCICPQDSRENSFELQKIDTKKFNFNRFRQNSLLILKQILQKNKPLVLEVWSRDYTYKKETYKNTKHLLSIPTTFVHLEIIMNTRILMIKRNLMRQGIRLFLSIIPKRDGKPRALSKPSRECLECRKMNFILSDDDAERHLCFCDKTLVQSYVLKDNVPYEVEWQVVNFVEWESEHDGWCSQVLVMKEKADLI
jgi:hypothetical protein